MRFQTSAVFSESPDWCKRWKNSARVLPVTEPRSSPSPAEVQQSSSGAGNAAVHPGQEVELGDGARLVGLQVLQVEAAHQEVLAPDVLRHQVDLGVWRTTAREAMSREADFQRVQPKRSSFGAAR